MAARVSVTGPIALLADAHANHVMIDMLACIMPRHARVCDGSTPAVTAAPSGHERHGQSFAKTTTPLAGITTKAEATKPCIGAPLASTPAPFPATHGLTQLS